MAAGAVRLFAGLLAALCIAVGLLWVGQGTGLVRWPASSFMIAEMRWAIYGAVLLVAGLVLMRMALRRRP